MEINLALIEDIETLKKEKEEKVRDFNKLGGIKEYKAIQKQLAERDRMLDFIEASEKGALPNQQSIIDGAVS